MDIGFVWDETKYKAVLKKHEVYFYEVVAAFDDPDGFEVLSFAEPEERWIWIGKTPNNRLITIVYSEQDLPLYRIITALDTEGRWSMNTTNEKPFDYQAYMRENSPSSFKIQRGIKARKQRLKAAMKKTSIQIDEDLIAQFKDIAPTETECEALINHALSEWLLAQDIKKLVKSELQQMFHQSIPYNQTRSKDLKVTE